MESSRVGGLDETDLKKALQKAKDVSVVEQEQNKRFYKDLLYFPWRLLSKFFKLNPKKLGQVISSSFSSKKMSIEGIVGSSSSNLLKSIGSSFSSIKVFPDESSLNNTDQKSDVGTAALPIPKDLKGVVAYAAMKKRLILLEQNAKERVAARKLETKKAHRVPRIKSPAAPRSKNESVKYKLDSKGRLHSTFKVLTATPSSLFQSPIGSIGEMVMGENNMKCEDDIENIFFLSRPYIFFESIQILSMIISIYQAVWFTNFVAINGNVMFKVLSVVPSVLCAMLYVYIVKSAALLQAIYRVDYECVLEVMEAMESSRALGRLIREKLLAFCQINIDELNKETKDTIFKLFLEIDDDGNGNLRFGTFSYYIVILILFII